MKKHIINHDLHARYLLTIGKITAAAVTALLLSLPGCGRERVDEHPDFTAKILDLPDGGALVEPLITEEEIRKSADWIYFGTKELDPVGAEIGDIVSVSYTGDIAESYPAQIQALEWEIVEKAENANSGGEDSLNNYSAEETQTDSEINAVSNLIERNLDAVAAHLSEFPDKYEELRESESYMIVHGKPEHGEEYWEHFYQSVLNGEPAEIDIVQFTTEGDAIIDYLNFDGTDFYLVHDNTRDAFGGSLEKYNEYTLPCLKVYDGTIAENGKIYREILLTDTESLTFEQLEEYLKQGEASPVKIYYIASIFFD